MLDSPEVNAFALPGGYVYVTRGIMAYLDSEAELAGVIGHEIGHVTARHGAQRATRQQSAGLGVLAATVLGAVLEGARRRRRHRTWPARCRRAWPRAGWPPTAASRNCRPTSWAPSTWRATATTRRTWSTSSACSRARSVSPPTRRAPKAVRRRPAPTGCRRTPATTSAWQTSASIAAGYQGEYADDGRTRYLQAIDGMSFGESRAQGVTRGRNFFHEELGIAVTAPQGWQLQNEPQAITLVNGAGDAGLIVQLMPAQGRQARTTRSSATSSSRPKGASSGAPSTVWRRRSSRARAATTQGQTQAVRVLLVTGPAQPQLPSQSSGEGRRGAAARRGTAGRGRGVVPPAQRRRPRRRAALGAEDGALPTRRLCRAGALVAADAAGRSAAAAAQRRLLPALPSRG